LLTCKQLLESLNDYLDQSMSPDDRAHMEAHVTACPNCWVVVDTTKKTLQVFRGMEPQPLPQSVHDRLMKAIEKRCASKEAT